MSAPLYASTLRDTERREDVLLAARLADHDRVAALLASILTWAVLPEAGQPGREIVRLLADHGRQWVQVDPQAQVWRAERLGVRP